MVRDVDDVGRNVDDVVRGVDDVDDVVRDRMLMVW